MAIRAWDQFLGVLCLVSLPWADFGDVNQTNADTVFETELVAIQGVPKDEL